MKKKYVAPDAEIIVFRTKEAIMDWIPSDNPTSDLNKDPDAAQWGEG